MYKGLEKSIREFEIDKSFVWVKYAFNVGRIWGAEGGVDRNYTRFEGFVSHPNEDVEYTHTHMLCLYVDSTSLFR